MVSLVVCIDCELTCLLRCPRPYPRPCPLLLQGVGHALDGQHKRPLHHDLTFRVQQHISRRYLAFVLFEQVSAGVFENAQLVNLELFWMGSFQLTQTSTNGG